MVKGVLKKIGAAVLISAGVCAGALTAAGDILLKNTLARKNIAKKNGLCRISEETRQWTKKTPVESVYLLSQDGLYLHAFKYIQPEYTHRWIIAVHGYNSSAGSMAEYARKFYENGYNVLMPDCRAHGESEGEYFGMGWKDKKDILRWINELLREDIGIQIGLVGLSMGAAAVMMTAGETLPENVKCVVEDCGYTSAYEIIKYRLKNNLGFCPDVLMRAVDTSCSLRAGYRLSAASAEAQLAKTKLPVFFIHGEEDTYVPFEMVHRLYNAAAGERELMTVPGAAHAEAMSAPDYWPKILDFCSKYID